MICHFINKDNLHIQPIQLFTTIPIDFVIVMSTAFMVDNILTVSGDSAALKNSSVTIDHRSESMTSSSDTESDAMSDIKDSSLCGSPRRVADTMLPLADRDKYQLSESILRTYAMIRQGSGVGTGLGTGSVEDSCCAKCGHFQPDRRSQTSRKLGTCVDEEEDIEMMMDFRCEKCNGREAMSTMLAGRTSESNTVLKDGAMTTIGANGVTKPFLKFSVSAILGDRKECVKVRNGKWLVVGNHLPYK